KRQYQDHPAASFLRHDSSSTMHSGAHDIKEMQIRNRWPLYSFIICMGESKRHCCHTGEWTLFGNHSVVKDRASTFERRVSVLHVWADAICINQLDDKERLLQVHLMGLIYCTRLLTIRSSSLEIQTSNRNPFCKQ